MSAVVADCDVLNFTLIHLKLGVDVQGLLSQCGRQIISLDRVYRREAQAPLRSALDHLREIGLCELVTHPSERSLAKKHSKILQKVYRLAERYYPLTSENDRGLLVEAECRSAPLFTEDGPLRALAAARKHPTFDALDLVALLYELQCIDTVRRDSLQSGIAARMLPAPRADTNLLRERGSVIERICSPPEEQGADDASEPAP